MAELEDIPQDEEENLSPEQLQEALESDHETTETPPDSDDVPEKYRGKSVKEIITMHQEAERALGRQSGEVGELRSLVDSFIQNQSSTQQLPQEPEPVPDYFENPEVAVSHAIKNHPDVVAAREAASNIARSQAVQSLNAAHPDAGEIVKSSEFADFVKGSPIRTELFVRAEKNFDYAAADELLTAFKARKKAVETTAAAEQGARRQQLQSASTGTARGSAESQGKRIYRRADIIRLMRDDPHRYEQLSPEITLAYQEGRVR